MFHYLKNKWKEKLKQEILREQADQQVPISFRCYQEDWDVIPVPYPAGKFMPEWFKTLKPKVKDEKGKQLVGFDTSTIKRCPPFLDALTAGYIIPLAADVHIKSNEDCSRLTWEWKFNKTLIEEHSPKQLNEEKHPAYPKWPFKWLNYWSIKVPDGYSVLFVDPLNRNNDLFTSVAGYVDCDRYEEFINFPFFWTKPNADIVIPAGTPLIQAIPIRRDKFSHDCHAFLKEELEQVEKIRRRRQSHESYYRDQQWVRK